MVQRTIRGAMVLGTGKIVEGSAALVRNVVIANVIGPHHMGVAAAFMIVATFIQIAGDMAVDRLLVQADDGDDDRLLSTAHSLQLGRGALGSLALLLLAGPFATLFGVAEAVASFRWLALAPLLRSLLHLDVHRFQREMRFAPWVMALAVPQLMTAALALPVAHWFGDYRAALWLLLGQILASSVISHVVAERPYRLAIDLESAKPILRFGWPLLLNGLLLFAMEQGDRVVVGSMLGPETLGIYAVAAMLALNLSTLVLGVTNPLFFPPLAQAKNDPARFERRRHLTSDVISTCAVAFAVFLLIGSRPTIEILFTDAYVGSAALLQILGLSQAIRMLRVTPTLAAMAKGDTLVALGQSTARTIGLVVAIVAGSKGEIILVAWSMVIGESAALVVGLHLVQRRHAIAWRRWMTPLVRTALLAIAAAWVSAAVENRLGMIQQLVLAIGAAGAAAGGIVLSQASLRHELSRVWRIVRVGREAKLAPLMSPTDRGAPD